MGDESRERRAGRGAPRLLHVVFRQATPEGADTTDSAPCPRASVPLRLCIKDIDTQPAADTGSHVLAHRSDARAPLPVSSQAFHNSSTYLRRLARIFVAAVAAARPSPTLATQGYDCTTST